MSKLSDTYQTFATAKEDVARLKREARDVGNRLLKARALAAAARADADAKVERAMQQARAEAEDAIREADALVAVAKADLDAAVLQLKRRAQQLADAAAVIPQLVHSEMAGLLGDVPKEEPVVAPEPELGFVALTLLETAPAEPAPEETAPAEENDPDDGFVYDEDGVRIG